MKKTDKIFVAGHNGMVGSAIVRELRTQGFENIITQSRKELDLTQQQAVNTYFEHEKPDIVFLAAAKVGGIHANKTYPAEFIYDNLSIQNNIIHSSYQADVQTLVFLGSSCIYPKHSDQPIKEEYLLSGLLESTNEPYAIAKIAGIKLCESYNRQYGTDFRSIMPTNLYGPGDNFHPENSHVLPALIRRFHEASINKTKEVVVWGSGKPRREFLYVDDMAKASIHVANLNKDSYNTYTQPMCSHINVGYGSDVSIKELAKVIAEETGFSGRISFDHSKPDGTMKKLIDSSKLTSLGWSPRIELRSGIKQTIEWYKEQLND